MKMSELILHEEYQELTQMSAEEAEVELGPKNFQDTVLQVQDKSLAALVSLKSGLRKPVEKIRERKMTIEVQA
ncbi:hypothetical protein H920_12093 [Fukomys damarensis]|uniref:Uncharacterized protein n=1 Tax=Fukomys damarensis TaxID=885580 RepID=A0A091D8C2_FUKDA|nr:hypothetical protein H920_12093 [Fukomys damarensis]